LRGKELSPDKLANDQGIGSGLLFCGRRHTLFNDLHLNLVSRRRNRASDLVGAVRDILPIHFIVVGILIDLFARVGNSPLNRRFENVRTPCSLGVVRIAHVPCGPRRRDRIPHPEVLAGALISGIQKRPGIGRRKMGPSLSQRSVP